MKVQWQPWTRGAFDRARAEDTLVFLSVHAKWCSWCRLMDETTYADPEVAELLSKEYVPVRIDADVRPDLTERYNMGGWPSTLFLTADADILWGATFLPPEQLRPLLRQFRSGFQQFRERILEEVARREDKIRLIESSAVTGRVEPTGEIVRKTILGIQMTFDPVHGGFGRAPKFPMPESMELLFQALRWTGGSDFDAILRKTLDAMASRSLFDPVDGGFHRYCTTEGWGAPQTEKLLEENAKLARCYLRGWQAFGEPRYRETAERTLDWAMRTLWEPGKSRFANGQVADIDYFGAEAAKRRTLKAPAVDRTVVTSANAAMVSTLVQSWAILGVGAHLDTARACLDAIRRAARRPEGGIAHLPEDPASETGLLRDPLSLATASLDLFEASGDPTDLEEARKLCEGIARTHGRPSGLVDRVESREDVGKHAAPRKEIAENAAAADLFLRLAAHTEDAAWRGRAADLLAHFPDYLGQYGHVTAGYAIATARLLREPAEIWLVEAPDEVRRAAVASAGPGRAIRIADRAGAAVLGLGPGPAAYVCVGARRLPPARTAAELEDRLVAAD
jgi:uncharacterized protein YyaL (SSP411 family)